MHRILQRISLLLPLFGAMGCTGAALEPEPVDPASLKILFIGNSWTYYNDMPGIVKRMATASRKNTYVAEWTQGGATLAYFAQDANAERIIGQQKWDFVILQDGTYRIIYPENHQELAGPISHLRDIILRNNPDTKILFHMLDAPRNSQTNANWPHEYAAYTLRIVDGTKAFTQLVGLETAPVGLAWYQVVVNSPSIDLYTPDFSHPSYAGSYLMACVYYSTIFRESSENNPYIGEMPEGDARVIQSVASEITLNFGSGVAVLFGAGGASGRTSHGIAVGGRRLTSASPASAGSAASPPSPCHRSRVLSAVPGSIDQILTHVRTRAASGARPEARSPPLTAVSVARAARRRPTASPASLPAPCGSCGS